MGAESRLELGAGKLLFSGLGMASATSRRCSYKRSKGHGLWYLALDGV